MQKVSFSCSFNVKCLYFQRFLMVDLAHFRGPQMSWGALGGPPGGSWGHVLSPQELSEGALEEARTRLEGPRGVLETEFGDPELVREGQNSIKTMLFR